MLASYLDTAMERAHYEIIEDEGSSGVRYPAYKASGRVT